MTKFFDFKILILGFVIFILSFFVPSAEFEELIYLEGTVVDISLKKNGVGAIVDLKNEKQEIYKLRDFG